MMGNVLRTTVNSFGLSGAVKWDGFLINGMAEITPWEKTKEPTPISILFNSVEKHVKK
jgi:hypothetical protein